MHKFFTQTIWGFLGGIFTGLTGSFDTKNENGWSARKLTAWAAMILIAYIVFNYVDSTNAIEALIVLCLFVLICLGLVVVEKIVGLVSAIKNKNSGDEKH